MVKLHEKLGKKNPKKGKFGIEVEVEDYLTESTAWDVVGKHWRATDDHSLQCGLEFVTKAPLSYRAAVEALGSLTDYIRAHKPSVRTGVHVHLNVTNKTAPEIYTLILLYAVLERVLCRYCGPQRDGNLFCMRLSDCPYQLDLIAEAYKNGRIHEQTDKLGTLKYAALNLGRMWDLGTVEFRALGTPLNLCDVEEWLRIIQKLETTAFSLSTPKDVFDFVNSVSAERLLEIVFDKELAAVLSSDHLEEDVAVGKRLIRRACRVPEVHFKMPKPEVEEPVTFNLSAPHASLSSSYEELTQIESTSVEEVLSMLYKIGESIE